MAEVTVKQFADVVDIPLERLLSQLGDAGVAAKKPSDNISEGEKKQLLAHLRHIHGNDMKNANKDDDDSQKVTLKRKVHSEIQLPTGTQGTPKTVSVEVRKKRSYEKRSIVGGEKKTPELSPLFTSKEEQQALTLREFEAEILRKQTKAEDAAKVEAEEKARIEEEIRAKAEAEKKAKQAEIKAKKAAARKAEMKAREEAKARKETLKKEAAKSGTNVSSATNSAKATVKVKTRPQRKTEIKATAVVKAKPKPEPKPAQVATENKRSSSTNGQRQERTGAGANRRPRPAGAPAATGNKAAPAINNGAPAPSNAAPGKDGKSKKKRHDKRRNDKEGSLDSLNAKRKGRNKRGRKQDRGVVQPHGFTKPTAPIVHEVSLPETISVADLAQKMSVKAAEVIKTMMHMGSMVTINQMIDQETASIVVEEMGHTVVLLKENALEEALDKEELIGEQVSRAPVVTIMGHVDHGKTSLLDHIRETRVAAGEAGGITQHIGAYHVETPKGMISFLDTPGHAAFTQMRARGAKVTDIVILVVAADDGVMPQTIEAVQHARAAGVPLIVAVNKIDKAGAEPERIRQELVAHEVVPEEWGGDVMFIEVSAKTGQGIDALLDGVLLQAEVLELTTVEEGLARAVVIESRLDKGRGVVATLLVQSGTLNKGDILLAGREFGRVRAMLDETGHAISVAGPSIPVEVLGLSGTPSSGDEAIVVPDEKKAREIALFRQGKFREVKLARQQAAKLDNMFSQMQTGEVSTVNIVLKADVNGSVEALSEALVKLSNEEVKVNIVAGGVGGINESDVNLAVASNAIVIGFNVRADASARRIISEEGIDLHYYSVIYEAIDEVKRAISGLLSPDIREEIIGLAQVRDVFRSPKIGSVAGCMVTEGVVKRNSPIRVLRDNIVIYEGELESLRRFKDDTAEVKAGTECGIGVKNYNDVKVGDQIEVYERVSVARTLA